jgi:hypothetical protein
MNALHPLRRPSASAGRTASVPRRPGNAIDVAAVAFARLCERRPLLTVDGTAAGCGLPARPLPLRELRSMLLHPATGPAARDAALTALRCDTPADGNAAGGPVIAGAAGGGNGADRQLALIGLLLPGLRHAASRLQREFPHADTDDLTSELVCGVLEALRGFDPAGGRIARGVVRARQSARTPAGSPRTIGAPAGLIDAASAADLAGQGPAHPDFTLAAAVRAGVVTAADAELIARTRLEAVPLCTAAAQLGLLYPTARRRRARAERRLVPWLRTIARDDDTPAGLTASRSALSGLSHPGGC